MEPRSIACAKPNALKMVDAIQHKALRIALRALSCTPGALLEEEAGILPLDLRRNQQSLNFLARAKSRHGSNPVNKLVGTDTFIKGRLLKRKHVALPVDASIWTLVEDCRPRQGTCSRPEAFKMCSNMRYTCTSTR
ncbi:hypothetical protein DPMN_125262 [Dreissena polymorpha]|uniref:Uncharacterized protein n=1 Tax=Dreissena polymorpha TaxID=45954 RepID=A0A9D4JTC5_DREPO|nr:hypothetical protein DPMN_125262 [Dreissena polymorpha]